MGGVVEGFRPQCGHGPLVDNRVRAVDCPVVRFPSASWAYADAPERSMLPMN